MKEVFDQIGIPKGINCDLEFNTKEIKQYADKHDIEECGYLEPNLPPNQNRATKSRWIGLETNLIPSKGVKIGWRSG